MIEKRHIKTGEIILSQEEKEVLYSIIQAGQLSEGPKVNLFQKEFARYLGTQYCVAVNSGTSALVLGLECLRYDKRFRISEKPKIITTPITYIATSNAIVLNNLEPVFLDITPDDFAINPELIEEYLKNNNDSSVILPVHLFGYACDMDRINEIARKYGQIVFEDASQAHGTVYKGKRVGSLSTLSSFSFYIAHNIQVGELGTLHMNDLKLNKLALQLKANGRRCDCQICTRKKGICPHLDKNIENELDEDPRFTHEYVSYNFKTVEFQAALALEQLKKIEVNLEKRRHNVKYLNEKLNKFSEVLKLPKYDEGVSYLAYPIVIKDTRYISRKKLRFMLEKQGVETRPIFGCIPTQQPSFSFLKNKYIGKLPNAEFVGKNGFYIGCHQFLTDEDLDYVAYVFENILK